MESTKLKKLVFKKETIASLSSQEQRNVFGASGEVCEDCTRDCTARGSDGPAVTQTCDLCPTPPPVTDLCRTIECPTDGCPPTIEGCGGGGSFCTCVTEIACGTNNTCGNCDDPGTNPISG